MAYIKTLKDNELIGGTDNTDVYPVSTTQAIFSQKPDGTIPDGIKHQRLEDRLFDGEEDARELHRKAEKLVVYLQNNQDNKTLEIKEGNVNSMTLVGSAKIETFGDEPADDVSFDDMSVKRLTISSSSGTELLRRPNWGGTETWVINNAVGQYTARFDCTYNGVSKYAETSTNVNLRKYFGFSDTRPSNIEALGSNHFSNSVSCTTLIHATGIGFKHIYFAVPQGMEIHKITQPDALNAPLAFNQDGIVVRIINGTSYNYRLYKSTDLIDSTKDKNLTIS